MPAALYAERPADVLHALSWTGLVFRTSLMNAQTFLMMLMTARMGLDASMRSMISRAVGARNVAYANHVLLQALTLTTVYSILLVTVGVILTYTALRALGLSDPNRVKEL